MKKSIAGMLALIASAGAFPLVDGASAASLYSNSCAMCHQQKAEGVPGVFPKLAGRIGTIAATPAGRTYLLHALLNGVSGQIQVEGKALSGVMPSQAGASDQDLADTLNYILKLAPSKAKPFTAAEVTKARADKGLTPAAIKAERTKASVQ